MKRILLGLLVLGLALSVSMLGCRLPASEEAAEQTQVSFVDATTKAFTSDVSDTKYSGGASSSSSTDLYAIEETTRASITFKSDGTWEYKVEKYEKEYENEAGGAGEDFDGDGTKDEGWVQIAGATGTYSYDPSTFSLTITNTGVYYKVGATPAYSKGWASSDPAIAAGDVVSITMPGVLTDIAVDVTNPTGIGGDGTITGGGDGREFWSDIDGDGNVINPVQFFNSANVNDYYHGGTYEVVTKSFSSGSWSSPTWTYTHTNIMKFEFTEDQITYYSGQTYSVTGSTYTDLSAGGSTKDIYTYSKSPDYAINSGNIINLSNIIHTKSYAQSGFSTSTGAYTYSSTATAGGGDVTNIGNYTTVTAVLDSSGNVQGYILY